MKNTIKLTTSKPMSENSNFANHNHEIIINLEEIIDEIADRVAKKLNKSVDVKYDKVQIEDFYDAIKSLNNQ